MTDKKDKIKTLKTLNRLDKILLTGTLASMALSFAAKSTNHEKLAIISAGSALTFAVGGLGTAIKKYNLEYKKAKADYDGNDTPYNTGDNKQ